MNTFQLSSHPVIQLLTKTLIFWVPWDGQQTTNTYVGFNSSAHHKRILFLSVLVSHGELCQKPKCATLAASLLFPGASPCQGGNEIGLIGSSCDRFMLVAPYHFIIP